MTSNVVRVTTEDGVRTITINRPEAFNSLNRELRLELLQAFTSAANDAGAIRAGEDRDTPEVRAVVLRAEGKAFCAGQDLQEQLAHMQAGTGMDKVVNEYNPMMAALLSIPVPVIAEIAGPAAGAGWGIAMACDFRYVSTQASFKAAFTGVGLAADSGLSATLVQRLGRSRTLEVLLLDDKLDADRAQELGLVTEVVAPEELAPAVADVASKLAKGPTAAYKEMKQLIARPTEIERAAEAEAEAQERLAKTEDHLEAITAFVEKRRANYRGI